MPLRARKRLDLKRGIVELYYGLLGVCRGRRRRREKARAREREREAADGCRGAPACS